MFKEYDSYRVLQYVCFRILIVLTVCLFSFIGYNMIAIRISHRDYDIVLIIGGNYGITSPSISIKRLEPFMA